MALALFPYSAITAKCRAKSAKLLKYDDYHAVCVSTGLAEAASYLCEHGDYKKELEDVTLAYIDRASLEELFANAFERMCSELFAFADGEVKQLISLRMGKRKIVNVLAKAARICENTGADSKQDIPATVEEYVSLFRTTQYYKAVCECVSENGKIDIIRLESVLYSAYYTELIKAAEKTGDKDVVEITRKVADFRNLEVVLRARLNFGLQGEEISPYLIKIGEQTDSKDISQLCTMDSKALARHLSIYSDSHNIDSEKAFSIHRNMLVYRYYRKVFASTKPSFGVLFAYIGLCETEVTNLVHVIEGLRYKLAPEKIMQTVACERLKEVNI